MRLLVDQNLSASLVSRLADLFPRSIHVKDLGLERAHDADVWARARGDDYTLVTKDRDFARDEEFPGPPPKCILLEVGNASTDEIEVVLRRAMLRIAVFGTDDGRLLTLR